MDRSGYFRNGDQQKKKLISSHWIILFFIYLMFTVICCSFATTVAQAHRQLPYSVGLMVRYSDLTEKQKDLFSVIYDGIRSNEESVSLPANTKYDDVTEVMTCIYEDCPELCNLNGHYVVRYLRLFPDIATDINLEYRDGPQTVDLLIQKAQELCNGIQGDVWTREKQIYDFLIDHCSYEETKNAFCACGPILDGKAVCEGYARAYMLLLRLSGIRCGLINGNAATENSMDSHSWNIVDIDGYTLYCDVTWDDTTSIEKKLYHYFNVPELHKHEADKPVKPISLTNEMTWHAKNGALIRKNIGREEIISIILEQIETNGYGNIRFDAIEDYYDFKDNFSETAPKIIGRIKERSTLSYRYYFNDDQYCFWISIG